MKRSRVTIRDVAAQAHVSHQTVSRVVNGREYVAPETADRVRQAIAALNYRPHAIARSMARGRAGLLGCVAPNLTDYTSASIIDGADAEMRQQGYFLLSAAAAADMEDFGALIDQLVNGRRIEGLIVINPYPDDRHLCIPTDFPVVFAGSRPRHPDAYYVALDDAAAARAATEHLLALGHRRIGHITGPLAQDCPQERRRGFQEALLAAGVAPDPQLEVEGDWLAQSGYQALQQLATRGPLPSAIFAQNDQMAVGALRLARDLELELPAQLSVIGVDDIPMSAYFSPPLTTMRQDFQAIGQEAARLLLGMIEENEPAQRQLLLKSSPVLRRSTAQFLAG
jgi:DNA-binding LacI/PurR family transcriptional regulator